VIILSKLNKMLKKLKKQNNIALSWFDIANRK